MLGGLRGTVYVINERMATGENTPIARFVAELDVETPEEFRAECARRVAARPAVLSLEVGTALEFGPIGKGWGK